MDGSNHQHTNPVLPEEIDVQQADALQRHSEEYQFLDIREPMEVERAVIEGSRYIPMMQIPMYLDALPKDRRLIVYCHHGQRSLRVARFLRQHGYNNVQSLKGGIDAWSIEVDPGIPRY